MGPARSSRCTTRSAFSRGPFGDRTKTRKPLTTEVTKGHRGDQNDVTTSGLLCGPLCPLWLKKLVFVLRALVFGSLVSGLRRDPTRALALAPRRSSAERRAKRSTRA